MALQPAVQLFLFDPSKSRETTFPLGILRARKREATASGQRENVFLRVFFTKRRAVWLSFCITRLLWQNFRAYPDNEACESKALKTLAPSFVPAFCGMKRARLNGAQSSEVLHSRKLIPLQRLRATELGDAFKRSNHLVGTAGTAGTAASQAPDISAKLRLRATQRTRDHWWCSLATPLPGRSLEIEVLMRPQPSIIPGATEGA